MFYDGILFKSILKFNKKSHSLHVTKLPPLKIGAGNSIGAIFIVLISITKHTSRKVYL